MKKKIEFETTTVINEFREFFKSSYPNDCSPRQKADIMASYLAGYFSVGCHFTHMIKNGLHQDGAVLMQDCINEDTGNRISFLIECMKKDDYSHRMFRDEME